MTDPQEYRQASRERWRKSAAGWRARREAMGRASMPVSMWMIEAVAPQPGHVLLELAAGLGDTGFLAAELVEPGGSLICSDFSPEMLTAAQERAEELGLRNVRFKQIDAESIDLEAASLDGVLCRWGYMLLADPAAGLRETRRVLKPGGRLALAAWTGPGENLWSALPWRESIRAGIVDPPDPSDPGQFAWADPARIQSALEAAGFVEDLVIERVAFTQRFASFEDWWASQRDLSSDFAAMGDGLDPGTLESLQRAVRQAAEPLRAPDGDGYAFPAATWVAAATA